jgi:sugar/nucleoside kinase (ribokinase family)
MSYEELDVTGIGNAIVDVLTHASEGFLDEHRLVKGSMRLIDAEEAEALYATMGSGIEVSGGSVGNTMAGLASLGSRCAYIGKVARDQLGAVFAHDIRAAGVTFETLPLVGGAPTARCLILVTPDGQRTMNTYLGACVTLGPEDIDAELISKSKVTYLEGYLFDPPKAQAAFRDAAEVAHRAGRRVAISLSDRFCVDRHRAAFLDLVEHHVDILFANESEIRSLYPAGSFDEALGRVREVCETAALTRSEKGSYVIHRGEVHSIAAARVEKIVDTTGAGDLYAAGFLYGYTHGSPPDVWGRMGSLAAAEAIGHVGARPEVPLAELFAKEIPGFAP